MCFLLSCRFDTNKSTKGASKLRRDLINAEIANLRDLLPLPQSTRQRLSQLQLMALVCVYVRKANYFQQGKPFFLILDCIFTSICPCGHISETANKNRRFARMETRYFEIKIDILFLLSLLNKFGWQISPSEIWKNILVSNFDWTWTLRLHWGTEIKTRFRVLLGNLSLSFIVQEQLNSIQIALGLFTIANEQSYREMEWWKKNHVESNRRKIFSFSSKWAKPMFWQCFHVFVSIRSG